MQIVSLGAWCQVAQQLKAHRPEQFSTSAFDWIVCPLKSVAKIFDTNGANFGEGLFIGKPQNSVECETYGILYHHDFPRDANNHAYITQDHAEKSKTKMTHKHQVMCENLNQTEETVTFVRFGGHAMPAVAWPYAKDTQDVLSEEINNIVASIDRALPKLNYRLLFIKCPTYHHFNIDESTLDPRVWVIDMPRRTGCSWDGDNEDWKVMLDMLPKEHGPADGKDYPFATLAEAFRP